MAPKFRFTREEIVSAALTVTRREGLSGLTARALAAELGSSVKPIFGLFQNMEEVYTAVREAAYGLYRVCLARCMADPALPPYKASGIGYIQFAREEKELFKLLFMCDRADQPTAENREEVRPLLNLIMRNLGVSEDEAYLLHMETWIFVHGIATMAATGFLHWDMDFISRSLTDIYLGLSQRHQNPSTPAN